MPLTQETFQAVVLDAPESPWELFHGKLVEKPSMSIPHNRGMARLTVQLARQLDAEIFEVRMNTGRLRYGDETYFIPDVHVIPVEFLHVTNPLANPLDALRYPMPFVAEFWSPSTGEYDVDRKLPEYQKRGDLEIWRLHALEHTVRIWRRRSDGGYDEREQAGGRIALAFLPNVTIDLDALFAF